VFLPLHRSFLECFLPKNKVVKAIVCWYYFILSSKLTPNNDEHCYCASLLFLLPLDLDVIYFCN
jgi:hypothetical protein